VPLWGTTHRLDADPVESAAQRTCVACGAKAFIADSDECWSDDYGPSMQPLGPV
jgi:hypothetical protein